MRLLTLVLLLAMAPAVHATEWAQPEIGCVEEVIPQEAPFPCLELGGVANPASDLPATLTPEEQRLWSVERRRALGVCRAREILRRETAAPGSMTPIQVEVSWMRVLGLRDTEAKIDAIYDSAASVGMPPQILLGALIQESLMADLGIGDDGGNFSCGIGQLNVLEWCGWAESLPARDRAKIGWPVDAIEAWRRENPGKPVCGEPLLSNALLAPYHRIAVAALAPLPAYRMGREHLAGIELERVVGSFPPASANVQRLRHAMVTAFVDGCMKFRPAIRAKASVLGSLFNTIVPPALRKVQQYSGEEAFSRACRRPAASRAHPLHSGWLLADAVYNAGGGLIPAIAWYLRLDSQAVADERSWEKLSPTDLISALHGAGKYNPSTDRLDYENLDGTQASRAWYKTCIVQRHVARVIQHVTLPGYELAQSLEDSSGCRKSVYDSAGNLVRTGVPEARQRASGRIEL